MTFCSDPAALRSILQNEGISTMCLGWTTLKPTGSPSNASIKYIPQRVSIMRSRQKAGPTAAKSVQFSPDPAALTSILQNEGIKVNGHQGATPLISTRPSGRGTSVYTNTSSLSSAAALLRRRLPCLEDLRLDEEVATYSSALDPALPALHPPQPRCGNPLASVLLFKDSTTFFPIIFDGTSASACTSPLRER
ncbi:uncharacterized protein troap [Aplochiton taeniatus]